MLFRIKYFAKAAVLLLLAALLVGMAVFALTDNEITLRARSDDIYKMLTASAEPIIININSASVRELQKLNGIGEVTANAIVTYRVENGLFSSVEDLLNVRGIGKATLEKIIPYISL